MRDKKVMVDNDPTEVFYECDPKKATTCHKTTCYINGGFRDKLEDKIHLLYPFTDVQFSETCGITAIVIRYFIYGDMRGFTKTFSTDIFNHDSDYRNFITELIITDLQRDIAEQILGRGGKQ